LSLTCSERVVIFSTITIYTVTGSRILKKRSELRSVSRNSHQPSAMRNMDPFARNIVVTTQIKCKVQSHDTNSLCVSPEADADSVSSFSSTRMLWEAYENDDLREETQVALPPIRTPKVRLEDVEAQHTPHESRQRRNGYRATVIATNTMEPIGVPTTLSSSRAPIKRTPEGHAAAIAYFQVAFLMFVAMFVVWLPSSVNRMYQFVYRDRPSFALNIISAIVLPLQGAWNATIYIFTSRAECKRAWRLVTSKLVGKPAPSQPRLEEYHRKTTTDLRDGKDSEIEIILEEMSKQGVQVRRSEVVSLDEADDAIVHSNRESQ
jgi:hypothetical protein